MVWCILDDGGNSVTDIGFKVTATVKGSTEGVSVITLEDGGLDDSGDTAIVLFTGTLDVVTAALEDIDMLFPEGTEGSFVENFGVAIVTLPSGVTGE